MILTSSELTSLRNRPHNTKLWLSVYEPTTILSCRLNNASATKGDRSIPYDGVITGSYLLVQSGMTMYVGSSAGAFDKGTIRVRSATTGTFTVAENSHINWADDDYLTVVNFYEINAIYPRIIQDPADAENTLWYKDYDIEYTDQNTVLGSFVCMGSHYAGFVGDNVFYSATGTVNLKGETLSYDWFFEGATVTGSSDFVPGNRVYNTPGHYTTRLTVSSASGSSDTSYRHVSIYDRPASGTYVPIMRWELEELSGGRDQGGYLAKIKVWENIASTKLKDGSLVVVFADDWYGDLTTKQSLGGNAAGRSTIVFVGYILQGSIRYNYRDSYVEFEVGSPSEIMKQAEGFSISVQHSDDPSTATSDPNIPSAWVTILDMDIRRAVYHYLRWHSTVMLTNDFRFLGTDRAIQYFDADRTSIYDAINTVLDGALFSSLVCDRQGTLWAERHIAIEPTAYSTNMEITKQDWMGDIQIDERRMDRLAFLELGGIAFSGATGTYTPLLSQAPGVAPGYRGGLERKEGLALISQDELNTMSGDWFAYKNSEYPNIEMRLVGNYRHFDIAPQEKIPLTVTATDTVRGITFSSKNFFITRMSWEYSSEKESLIPSISLSELTDGFSGDTVTIPEAPNVESGGFNIPSFTFPQINIPPFPTISIGGGGNFPIFVPADGGTIVGTGGTPLEATTNANGPAVLPVPSASDGYIGGGFVVPAGYAGTITVYMLYIVSVAGGAGSLYFEHYIERLAFTTDHWDSVANQYNVSNPTLTGYTSGRLYATLPLSLSVIAGDFVTLWSRKDAETFDKTVGLAGWYIEYG